jgi:hypothetical protein
MHGRTNIPATFAAAHVKKMGFRKFGACLALRHATRRAISQRRPDHDGDGSDESNGYPAIQLAAPKSSVGYTTFHIVELPISNK